MSKIYINDANIYYEEHGQGSETILFIHGLFMNCRMYDHQVEALKDRYRCVVFDLRGQGSSEVTAGGYGIYDLVDDAALVHIVGAGGIQFGGLGVKWSEIGVLGALTGAVGVVAAALQDEEGQCDCC